MMYFYWKKNGTPPSFFHNLKQGELTIITAFYELELEERSTKLQAIEKDGGVFPVYNYL